MCAVRAAAGGGRVLIVDHAKAPGEKIRISGGGRCNFTNLHCRPEAFISGNPHFCKSALGRYDQHDFIAMVDRHRIAWHEKTLGQLFCDGSAREIIAMLLAEMEGAGVTLRLGAEVGEVAGGAEGFRVLIDGRDHLCDSLVVATGGLSIPKMGATGFGYRVAERFGLKLRPTRAGLVPLTFGPDVLPRMKALAGVAVDARVAAGGVAFDEAVLFTHRGLSGPAILQASSYWREREDVRVDMAPGRDVAGLLRAARGENGRRSVGTALAGIVPKRLAADVAERAGLAGNLADMSDARLAEAGAAINAWELRPSGTEGYRTAEVTLGGVDTDDLDARTMAARRVPGLHFIGEVVDVTGWLGGYNFQWAWSSGWAAGTAIADASR